MTLQRRRQRLQRDFTFITTDESIRCCFSRFESRRSTMESDNFDATDDVCSVLAYVRLCVCYVRHGRARSPRNTRTCTAFRCAPPRLIRCGSTCVRSSSFRWIVHMNGLARNVPSQVVHTSPQVEYVFCARLYTINSIEGCLATKSRDIDFANNKQEFQQSIYCDDHPLK